MNVLKLQNDLLKKAYNRDYNYKKDDTGVYSVCEYECTNYLAYSDKHAVYMIPEFLLYIDINKIFPGEPTKALDRIINNSKDVNLVEVLDTDTIKMQDKSKLHIFKIDDEEIYVDEKLLKYFDFKNDISFFGAGKKSPIYVFEQDILMGLVLPTIL